MEYHIDTQVCVIGAGHAGVEAALACSRLGLKTVIFTMNVDSIAMMPCNPHIGGSSKGHLVREIDALGGEMGKNIDRSSQKIIKSLESGSTQALSTDVRPRSYVPEHISMPAALSVNPSQRQAPAACRDLPASRIP